MRICVITGGTGGIGLHLCEGFQRAGYAVTALDVEQHKALPDGIGFIQTDLRQAEAVNEAFRRVTERHGAVHVLVNNAALAHFHKPVMEMTADEFDNALSVNLRGAFLCAQAFIKANAGQDYGRIINIASTRWRTVSDQKNRVYFFESTLSPDIFWIDLKGLDFSSGAPVKKLSLTGGEIYAGNAVGEFRDSEPFPFLFGV